MISFLFSGECICLHLFKYGKVKSDMKYDIHTIFIVLIGVFYVRVKLSLLREPNSKLDFDLVIKEMNT